MSSITLSPTQQLELEFRQLACNSRSIDTMVNLSTKEIDINAKGGASGKTALHRAAESGNAQALRLLFNLGADFSITDSSNKTAEELAKGSETKRVFEVVKITKAALLTRSVLFPTKPPHPIPELSEDDEHLIYRKAEDLINEICPKLEQTVTTLIDRLSDLSIAKILKESESDNTVSLQNDDWQEKCKADVDKVMGPVTRFIQRHKTEIYLMELIKSYYSGGTSRCSSEVAAAICYFTSRINNYYIPIQILTVKFNEACQDLGGFHWVAIDNINDKKSEPYSLDTKTMLVDPFNGKAAFCEFLDAVPINDRVIRVKQMQAKVFLVHTVDELDCIPEADELIKAICEMMSQLSDSVCDDLNSMMAQELSNDSVRRLTEQFHKEAAIKDFCDSL